MAGDEKTHEIEEEVFSGWFVGEEGVSVDLVELAVVGVRQAVF